MRFNKNLFSLATLLCGLLCIGTTFSATATDANKRAVSEPSATIDLSGGRKDGNGNAAIGGIATIPLNDNFGLQLDSAYSKTASVDAGGLAGHYFYRDPEAYLIGATAMWYNTEGNDFFRYGLEGEYYLQDITIVPSIGLLSGSGIDSSTGFYGLDLSYYPDDNLKLTLSGEGYADTQGASGEIEWQPDESTPITTYITAGDSENSNTFAIIGIRYNFGSECASLKYRNRHSDPKNIVTGTDNLLGDSLLNDAQSGGNVPNPSCCSCSEPSSLSLNDAHTTPMCCPCSN